MTTITQTTSGTKSSFGAIFFAAVLGAAILVFAGHIQASTLHDAAHDTRHATGFPCH